MSRPVALRHLPLRPVLLSLVATVALLLAPSTASAAWTVPPTPNVAGANATSLNGVDCSSANSCMAVGNAVFPPAGFKLPERREPEKERKSPLPDEWSEGGDMLREIVGMVERLIDEN